LRQARRALVLLAALVTPACSYTAGLPEPYRPPGINRVAAPESGRELYLRDCAWCHGAAGGGTERGPDLVSGTNGAAFTDFMLSTGRMPIDSPDDASVRREPAYSQSEIGAITEYVAGLGGPGPDVPAPTPEFGDLAGGQLLYLENCAACHSTTLIGGALTTQPSASGGSGNAPSLRHSSAVEIEEAMLVGPGPMPVFGAETFTPNDFDSIVRYVRAQQRPDDRGGAALGHAGPVTEGAVAWILGLGALLAVSRWIGTRTED
jgi:ubiquinol-cytochrome c reductase cytochrome c subunit